MKILNGIFENKKNIYNIMIALAAGIALMMIGGININNSDNAADNEEYLSQYERRIEEKIENLLSKAEGVGRVQVSAVLKSGKEKVIKSDVTYETDEKEYRQSKEERAVYASNDTPFVIVEREPEIEGVVVVCEGGDSIYVKQKIISSVSALLGIEMHKIEVMKMKSGG